MNLPILGMDIREESEIQNIEFRGGGGTDFRPVFDLIKSENWAPSVLIYLTDGEGVYPSEAPSYSVVWAICNEGDVEVPFGKKIKINLKGG